MIKLNSSDYLDGGLDVDGMLAIASLLEEDGIDAIELSGGTLYSGRNLPIRTCRSGSGEEDVFHLDAGRRYKDCCAADAGESVPFQLPSVL